MPLPMIGRRGLTLRRRAGAVTIGTDGRHVAPAPVDSPITGSIQPLTRDDIKRLPEGARVDLWRKVFTETILIALNQHTGELEDQLVIDGEVYSVNLIDPWAPVAPLPHYEALCVRVKE